MESKLITAPTETPISLADVKEHLRIDTSDTSHDAYLTGLLSACVSRIESVLFRGLVTQTWDFKFDSWRELTLSESMHPRVIHYGMTQSITHIKYMDEDGAEQTVSTDYYSLTNAGTDGARIVFDFNDDNDAFDWPDLWPVDPITVRVVLGYGAAVVVPAPIKSAIKLMVGDLFDDEDSSRAIEALLSEFKLFGWGFS